MEAIIETENGDQMENMIIMMRSKKEDLDQRVMEDGDFKIIKMEH